MFMLEKIIINAFAVLSLPFVMIYMVVYICYASVMNAIELLLAGIGVAVEWAVKFAQRIIR